MGQLADHPLHAPGEALHYELPVVDHELQVERRDVATRLADARGPTRDGLAPRGEGDVGDRQLLAADGVAKRQEDLDGVRRFPFARRQAG